MEKAHHSIAAGPIFRDHFTLFTINLGGKLRFSTMADICDGTAEFIYDYVIWRFLL